MIKQTYLLAVLVFIPSSRLWATGHASGTSAHNGRLTAKDMAILRVTIAASTIGSLGRYVSDLAIGIQEHHGYTPEEDAALALLARPNDLETFKKAADVLGPAAVIEIAVARRQLDAPRSDGQARYISQLLDVLFLVTEHAQQ